MRNSTSSIRIRGLALAVITSLVAYAMPMPRAEAATVVTFTTPGSTSWTVPAGVTSVDVLVVAGGGGGGETIGGGGGGGGVLIWNGYATVPGASIAVTVGSGGTGAAAACTYQSSAGTSGGNSVFGLMTAYGGGGGGSYNNTSSGALSGGSGGGTGAGSSAGATSGVIGQGYNGGTTAANTNNGAGGGGAGAVGTNGVSGTGAAGGAGRASSISGSSVYYGGGGGGGARNPGGNAGGAGGTGGGGAGGYGLTAGTAGTANTGGGGGGGGYHNTTAPYCAAGGNGGSGIVIISYPGSGKRITFSGNVQFKGTLLITGTLAKSSGTFVIDHPLDPKHRLLYHSFVESPEPKNIYDGIAKLDKEGKAVITLPEYYEALNGLTRYQYFPLDEAMPNLHISEEQYGNRFTIAGGVPGGRVSWQVTGVRHDPYILAHPIVVEVLKGIDTPVKRGECLFEPLCI